MHTVERVPVILGEAWAFRTVRDGVGSTQALTGKKGGRRCPSVVTGTRSQGGSQPSHQFSSDVSQKHIFQVCVRNFSIARSYLLIKTDLKSRFLHTLVL